MTLKPIYCREELQTKHSFNACREIKIKQGFYKPLVMSNRHIVAGKIKVEINREF